jgi:hypothetical protein
VSLEPAAAAAFACERRGGADKMRGTMNGGALKVRGEHFESILRSIHCRPRLALTVARLNWMPPANPLHRSRIRG